MASGATRVTEKGLFVCWDHERLGWVWLVEKSILQDASAVSEASVTTGNSIVPHDFLVRNPQMGTQQKHLGIQNVMRSWGGGGCVEKTETGQMRAYGMGGGCKGNKKLAWINFGFVFMGEMQPNRIWETLTQQAWGVLHTHTASNAAECGAVKPWLWRWRLWIWIVSS